MKTRTKTQASVRTQHALTELRIAVTAPEFRALSQVTAEMFAGPAREVDAAAYLLKAALMNYEPLLHQLQCVSRHSDLEGVPSYDIWDAKISARFPVRRPRRRKAK